MLKHLWELLLCIWGFQVVMTLRQMEGNCVNLFSMYFESLSAFFA